jgi:hypothetical protein
MKQFNCLNCGKLKNKLGQNKNKYCSTQCQHDLKFKEKFELFLNDVINVFVHHKSTRRALIHRDGNKCSVCGITEWFGKSIVFEIEHKDGNSSNHVSSNLCLICPNCHSQTSTYKGANKGNGRHYRRQRYKEGKSY